MEFPSETVTTYSYLQSKKDVKKKNQSEPSKGKLVVKWRNENQSTKVDKELEEVKPLDNRVRGSVVGTVRLWTPLRFC